MEHLTPYHTYLYMYNKNELALDENYNDMCDQQRLRSASTSTQ